ncbi:Interaptin [Trichoplax sp. H2]|nr:Interaptin [Trichoplax sp. H2]|eukprot:RDD47819.1 Interaptin [Trichoplax sp. H2]
MVSNPFQYLILNLNLKSCSSTGIVTNGGIGGMNSGSTGGGINNANFAASSLPHLQYYYGSTGKLPDSDGSTAASIEQDKQECMKWINSYISKTGHPLIVNLEEQLSDGLTLIKLLEALAGERLAKYYTLPKLRVQKIENTKECINFMAERGINVTGIRAEELASGNVKTMLTMCHLLRLRVEANVKNGYPPLYKPPSAGISNSYINSSQSNLAGSQADLTTLDKEDLSVLSWVTGLTGIPIQSYNQFYDARILYEVVSKICGTSIPKEKLDILTPIERCNLAFDTAERELSIPKQVNSWDVTSGHDNYGVILYLKQLYQVYEHRIRQQDVAQLIEEEARQQRMLDERIRKLKEDEVQLTKHRDEVLQNEQKINDLAESVKQRELNLRQQESEESERIKRQMNEYTNDIMNRQVEQQLYNESKQVHHDVDRQLEQQGMAATYQWRSSRQNLNHIDGDRNPNHDEHDQYAVHLMKQRRRRQLGELELQKKQLEREWKVVEQNQQDLQRQWYQMQEQHNQITHQLTERQLELQRQQEQLGEKDLELKKRDQEQVLYNQQQQHYWRQKEEQLQQQAAAIEQKANQLQLLQKEVDMQQKYLTQEKSYVDQRAQQELLEAREKIENEKLNIKKQRDELVKIQHDIEERSRDLMHKKYEIQFNEQEETVRLRKRIEDIEKVVQQQHDQLLTEQKKRNDQYEEILELRRQLRLKEQQLDNERNLREKEIKVKEDELSGLEKQRQQEFIKRMEELRMKETRIEHQRLEYEKQLRTMEEKVKSEELLEQERRRQEQEKRLEELKMKEKLLEEEKLERERQLRLQEEKRKEEEILELERKRRLDHERRLQEKQELEERIRNIERLQQEVREKQVHQQAQDTTARKSPLIPERPLNYDSSNQRRPLNNALKPTVSESVLNSPTKSDYRAKSPSAWNASESMVALRTSSPNKSSNDTLSKSRLPMTKLGGSTSNLSNVGKSPSNVKTRDRYVEPKRFYENATTPAGVNRPSYVGPTKPSPKSQTTPPSMPSTSPPLPLPKTPEPALIRSKVNDVDANRSSASPTKTPLSSYTSPFVQGRVNAFARSNEMKAKYPNLPSTPVQKAKETKPQQSTPLSQQRSTSSASVKSPSNSKRAEATQLVRRGARTPGGASTFDF